MDVAFRCLAEAEYFDQGSAGMIEDFAVLSAEREKADTDISRWANKVDDDLVARIPHEKYLPGQNASARSAEPFCHRPSHLCAR